MFDGAADGLFARKVDHQGAIAWAPALESFRQADEVVIRCDIPGVDPSDVRVKVEGQLLTITGERKPPREISDEAYSIRGVTYGRFERSVVLPEGIDPGAVKAAYQRGVLEITVPRSATQQTVSVSCDAA